MRPGRGTASRTSHRHIRFVLYTLLLGTATLPLVSGSSAHARVVDDMPAPVPPPPPPGLPETPSRGDVSRALGERAADVRACAVPSAAGGAVTVSVTFVSSGAVQRVTMTATTLPASVQSCIAQAVMKARVPPFRASTFNVNFPFRY